MTVLNSFGVCGKKPTRSNETVFTKVFWERTQLRRCWCSG